MEVFKPSQTDRNVEGFQLLLIQLLSDLSRGLRLPSADWSSWLGQSCCRFTFTQVQDQAFIFASIVHNPQLRGDCLKSGSECWVFLYGQRGIYSFCYACSCPSLKCFKLTPTASQTFSCLFSFSHVPADLELFTMVKWRSLLDKFIVLWSANSSSLYIYIHDHYWLGNFTSLSTGPKATYCAIASFIKLCFRHLSLCRLGQNLEFL